MRENEAEKSPTTRWFEPALMAFVILYNAVMIPMAAESDGSTAQRLLATAIAVLAAHVIIHYAGRSAPKENRAREAFYAMTYSHATTHALKSIFAVQSTSARAFAGLGVGITVYAVTCALGKIRWNHTRGRSRSHPV